MSSTLSLRASSTSMIEKIKVSERVKRIKASPTLAIAAQAEALKAQGKPIISLSVGEPDFNTPNDIKMAGFKAIESGYTKYTAVDGIEALKTAIAKKFFKDNQLNYDLSQILVSSGAKQSLFNLFLTLLNPGDEVIIPAPYWVSYYDMALLADAKPVVVQTAVENHFKLTADELSKAITPKTKLLVLNSPSNPTGMTYTKAELIALGEVLIKHPEMMIVCDDIYEKILWNHLPFTNLVSACPALYERTVVVNGVSKTYAMTGWRIGYAAGPANIIAAMKKIQSQSTSSPSSISQYAALKALSGDQNDVNVMCKAYEDRHQYIFSELKQMPGFEVLPSDGTFYTFPSIANLLTINPSINNDIALSAYLLDKALLAVVPGSAFGKEGHIRISFATSKANLEEAMRRLKEAVNALHL